MKLINLIALACGIALGAALTTVGLKWRAGDFNPKPVVEPSFRAQFTPEFRAQIGRLRAAGEPTADLANLVVAEFDRQWELKPKPKTIWMDSYQQNYTPPLQAGRRQAVQDLLGRPALTTWQKQAILRCLRSDALGLDRSGSDGLYKLWCDWDANRFHIVLLWTSGDDALTFHRGKQTQVRQVIQYEAKLQKLLGSERYAQFARTHLAEWSVMRIISSHPLTAAEQIAINQIEMQMWDRFWSYLVDNRVHDPLGQDNKSFAHTSELLSNTSREEEAIINKSELGL